MWRVWHDEETDEWRIVRWRNGEKEFALGTWARRDLAELMCDRLNKAEDKSSRYKKRPAKRQLRQGRR